MKHLSICLLCFVLLIQNAGAQKWSENKMDSFDIVIINNKGGQKPGYASASGVKIITVDGFAFKDLDKDGRLDKYEDWRLPIEGGHRF